MKPLQQSFIESLCSSKIWCCFFVLRLKCNLFVLSTSCNWLKIWAALSLQISLCPVPYLICWWEIILFSPMSARLSTQALCHIFKWSNGSINLLSTICNHYSDVIMSTMVFQITSLTIVYSTIYLGADQRKHQSSASLVFVWGIHRWPVNSPHKWPVTWKLFPFDDVIMTPMEWRRTMWQRVKVWLNIAYRV